VEMHALPVYRHVSEQAIPSTAGGTAENWFSLKNKSTIGKCAKLAGSSLSL
jgi:hypothetical protein